jgi:hypothetical protein
VDGGAVKLTQSGGNLGITEYAAEGGSGVRFAKGIFAVMGNRPGRFYLNGFRAVFY